MTESENPGRPARPGMLQDMWRLGLTPGAGWKEGVRNLRSLAVWPAWLWRFLALGSVLLSAGGTMAAPPNLVLILADDLGAHDIGCYGADLHETPHLDRLARQGVRFTQAYAPSPVCSPTRAALLTGKHPARLGITVWAEGSLRGPTDRKLLQAASLHDLPHAEVTIAERLHDAGYLTALVGKWHLGDAAHSPETQGFDVNIGGTHWGAPQTHFWPYRGTRGFGGEYRYVPHMEFGRPGEYLTDRLTEEALRVIDRAARTKQPFFLYLAHHAPHTPIEAKGADVAHFRAGLRPGLRHQNPVYAAMVRSLDDNVGRVLAHLRRRGLEGNTVVVFASDNGGYLGTAPYEGRAIPHHYHAPPSTPVSAVRAGDWKLIEFLETDQVELFNLREDPSEERDVASRMPEKAAELRGRLRDWRSAVGARMPRPNPEFKPAAGG